MCNFRGFQGGICGGVGFVAGNRLTRWHTQPSRLIPKHDPSQRLSDPPPRWRSRYDTGRPLWLRLRWAHAALVVAASTVQPLHSQRRAKCLRPRRRRYLAHCHLPSVLGRLLPVRRTGARGDPVHAFCRPDRARCI